jgi:hypothetical protein
VTDPSLLPFLKNCWQGQRDQTPTQERGFALPLAMGMGFVMILLGITTVLIAQGDRSAAFQRKETGSSLAITEGGMARTLAQLADPNNAILLGRTYDTINPDTGKTYLGQDGVPNSGDEETTAIDEWTSYDPKDFPCFKQKGIGTPTLTTTGIIGTNGDYAIRAYRYDAAKGTGTLLVEGTYSGQSSMVLITAQIEPELDDFPGILAQEPYPSNHRTGLVALRGRNISGSKGNVYYVPSSAADESLRSLNGISAPGDSTRSDYLTALWSNFSAGSQDGASGDTIAGKVFACQLLSRLPLPASIPASNTFGTINTSTTLIGNGPAPTVYEIDKIHLAGTEVLTVDTTNGPVHIKLANPGMFSADAINLKGDAKILNYRSDGLPPQVGDLRIMSWDHTVVRLSDRACIQDVFLWLQRDEFRLLTSGPGCPDSANANFRGVVWVEAILSAKNLESNRKVEYIGGKNDDYDMMAAPTPKTTSGIAVSEDLSSLKDVLRYVDWPARYRFRGIQNWQRLRL